MIVHPFPAANSELAKWAYFRKNESISDNAELAEITLNNICKIAPIENQPLIKKMHFFLKIITKIFGQFRKKQ